MTRVTDVIALMHIQYRPILERMMGREGLNGDSTVQGVLKHFTPDKVKDQGENVALVALGGAESKHGSTKFAPQLTFDQRCEILGLHRIGYNADALAEAYGVDRRTITHIHNAKSTRYKNVRAEEKGIGPQLFIEKYVTPEVRAHVETFKVQLSGGNNPAANGMAGIHPVKGVNCEYTHRVVIGWCDPASSEVEVPGWYYKDMDGDFPNQWLRSEPDESLRTSRDCYLAMAKEITDKI
jgi:hypothetical protein